MAKTPQSSILDTFLSLRDSVFVQRPLIERDVAKLTLGFREEPSYQQILADMKDCPGFSFRRAIARKLVEHFFSENLAQLGYVEGWSRKRSEVSEWYWLPREASELPAVEIKRIVTAFDVEKARNILPHYVYFNDGTNEDRLNVYYGIFCLEEQATCRSTTSRDVNGKIVMKEKVSRRTELLVPPEMIVQARLEDLLSIFDPRYRVPVYIDNSGRKIGDCCGDFGISTPFSKIELPYRAVRQMIDMRAKE